MTSFPAIQCHIVNGPHYEKFASLSSNRHDDHKSKCAILCSRFQRKDRGERSRDHLTRDMHSQSKFLFLLFCFNQYNGRNIRTSFICCLITRCATTEKNPSVRSPTSILIVHYLLLIFIVIKRNRKWNSPLGDSPGGSTIITIR